MVQLTLCVEMMHILFAFFLDELDIGLTNLKKDGKRRQIYALLLSNPFMIQIGLPSNFQKAPKLENVYNYDD